ncbi:MAG: hypothetical protein WCN98_19825, partial [Verrucomicrobiaceae bacterium]
SEEILAEGTIKTFASTPYPRDFGEFSSANILVVNLHSRYKPFTIAMPYGIRPQPYNLDDPAIKGLQMRGNPPETHCTVPLSTEPVKLTLHPSTSK